MEDDDALLLLLATCAVMVQINVLNINKRLNFCHVFLIVLMMCTRACLKDVYCTAMGLNWAGLLALGWFMFMFVDCLLLLLLVVCRLL